MNTNKWQLAWWWKCALFLMLGVAVAQAVEEKASEVEQDEKPSTMAWIKRNFGMNYNSFFAGPGLFTPLSETPGYTGAPSDTGLNFFNLISVKWKFSERFAFDVQFRNQLVVTNNWEFRHQGQRFGISGKLLKGEDWSLTGAINSDIPIRAIAGQIPSERTLIMNPGMFAVFEYAPEGSRWSAFALVQPRWWLYANNNAVAVQDVANGGTNNKPEFTINLNPSINYAATDKIGIRFGTTLELAKNIGWASARRGYMPFELGVTYDISPAFSIYTYVLTSTPIDDDLRRQQLGVANPPDWTKTASINVWLSGTIF
ncbi:hypothetical protein K2X33_06000 [bacterium]|nr:hypothetical protein [bacterium]